MKKIYSLSILLLITIAVWSQKTWDGPGTGGSWSDANNWIGDMLPSASEVVKLQGISGTITNVPNMSIAGLIIEDATITLTKPGAGTNTLTITNGIAAIDFSIALNSTLNLGNGIDITLANGTGGNHTTASFAGLFNLGDGRTYNTNGNNVITNVLNFGIIEASPGSAVTSTSAAKLSFASGANYIHARDGGAVPEANWDSNSNCVITGVINQMPTGFNQEFGNLEWNSINQVPFSFPSFGGQLGDLKGDLIIKNTGTGALYLANNFALYSTVVKGDYIQTGGTFVITQESGNGSLELEGNFNMSGGTLARNSPPGGGNLSTIYFQGNAEQTFTKTGGTISGPLDFVVSPGASVNFGTSILDGSTGKFTLSSGATIITSHPDGLNSSGTVGTIQTTTSDFKEDADYEFRGPVTGIFNTGGSTDDQPSIVRHLTINNASGSVILSKPVTINFTNEPGPNVPELYLLNGALITTATNILTLNDNAQATGTTVANQYNLNSFVDGPMRKTGDKAFTFPVGKVGSGLHKIGISAPGNPVTSFTAQYFRNDPHILSNTLAPTLARISACEYWTLDRSGSTLNNDVRVILSWESNSACNGPYVTDILTLSVARLDATGTWVNEGYQPGSQTGTDPDIAGTIASDNVINTFSPFALASTSATENPLPVVFGDVKAYEKNGNVQIEWSNLTEKDVAEYTIERSANGEDFIAIATQWPTSNQNDKASYTGFDAAPGTGANYYRIKVVETTGKIVYSKILSVNLSKANFGLQLYPNPVRGNQVTISLSNMKRGQYNLRVVNATGQDVFKKIIINQSNSLTQTLDLPSTIKAGVYNMVITADGYRETKMFIVR